jgi:hypothetical protein
LDSPHLVYIYTHKLKNASPQFLPWHTLIEWAMDVSSQHEMKSVAKSSCIISDALSFGAKPSAEF